MRRTAASLVLVFELGDVIHWPLRQLAALAANA
jgi:hypothetical protein